MQEEAAEEDDMGEDDGGEDGDVDESGNGVSQFLSFILLAI